MNQIELQLYISNEWVTVDIDKKNTFSYSLRMEELIKPTAVKNSSSTQITLPYTDNNNRIFRNIWAIDSVFDSGIDSSYINPLIRIKMRLYVNFTLFQSGYIKINSANSEGYQINIFNQLGDMFYRMKEKYLDGRYIEQDDVYGTSINEKINDRQLFGNEFTHVINSDLVGKSLLNQSFYNTSGSDMSSFFGYALTYQGKYDSFDNQLAYIRVGGNLEQIPVYWTDSLRRVRVTAQDRESATEGEFVTGALDLTEHHRTSDNNNSFNAYLQGDYRSYYQKPYIKISKLFDKIVDDMTLDGWTITKDESFFGEHNPYWNELLMLCPNYEMTDIGDYLIDVNISQIKAEGGTPSATVTIPYTDNPYSAYRVYYVLPESITNSLANIDNSQDLKIEWELPFELSARLQQQIDNQSMALYPRGLEIRAYLQIGVDQNGNPNYYGALAESSPNDSSTYVMKFDFYNIKQYNPYTTKRVAWNYVAKNLGGDLEIENRGSIFTFSDINRTISGQTISSQKLSVGDGTNGNVRLFLEISGFTTWTRTRNSTHTFTDLIIKPDFENTVFKIAPTSEIGTRSGSTVDYNNIIRGDTTFYDLFMSYCNMFGIIFETGMKEKTINLKSRNTYWSEAEVIDWTDKLVKGTEEYTFIPFNYRKGILRYKQTDDKYEKIYRETNEYGYGSLIIDTNNQHIANELEWFSNIIFNNCICKSDASNYYKGRNPNQPQLDTKELPHFQDSSDERVNSGYTLLFKGDIVPVNSYLPDSVINISDDLEIMKTRGYCWNEVNGTFNFLSSYQNYVRTVEKPNGVFSLNFGVPSVSWNESDTNCTIEDTVYGRFHKNYIEDRYSINNKVLTARFYLSNEDIINNPLKKFIRIKNTLWVISKINKFDLTSDNLTEVELVRVNDKNAYTKGQKYPSGSFIIRYNGNEIYNSNTHMVNPEIWLDLSAQTIELEVESSYSWQITSISSGFISVGPMQGNAGITTVTASVPDVTQNTTYAIYFRQEPNAASYPIVFIRQRDNVNVTHYASPSGTTSVNGSTNNPYPVTAGQSVTLSTSSSDSNLFFGYWIIDGQYFYEQTVTYTVNDDTNAVAYWFDSINYTKLYCYDDFTSVEGVQKTGDYWILPVGVIHMFRNNRYNLSGYKFNSENYYRNPTAFMTKVITIDDTLLDVFYDTFLVNLTINNNSSIDEDTDQFIFLINPDNEIESSPIFVIPASSSRYYMFNDAGRSTENEVTINNPPAIKGEWRIEVDSYNYTLLGNTPFEYTGINNIPNITINIDDRETIGWQTPSFEISGDSNTITNVIEIPSYIDNFTITSSLEGVIITPQTGSSTTTVSFDIPANIVGSSRTIIITANINGYEYTFTILQGVFSANYWAQQSITVPYSGSTITNTFYSVTGVRYDITTDTIGISYAPTFATQTSVISFNIPQNVSDNPRTITATAIIGTNTYTFEINQQGWQN